eukprot:9750346-Ditylum_brightwellii.AAC.1
MAQEGVSVKEIEILFETQTTVVKKEKQSKQDRAKMMCQSKCGNHGHNDKRDIDCPLNAINIKNVWVVENTIESVPVGQKVYMGPKAKAT